MSGYELQKQLTAKLGAFWRVSFGSLYPCLKRLSGQGAIAVLDPPEPLITRSRKKHVYQLTEHGEALFDQMLSSTDVHDLEQDRFPLRLAFFRYLKPEMRLEQLERRRGYLQQRLGDLRASMRTARDRMDAYTLSLLDHGLEEREREIAWLDRLIASERLGAGEAAAPAAGIETTAAAPAVADSPAAARRAARRARRGTTSGERAAKRQRQATEPATESPGGPTAGRTRARKRQAGTTAAPEKGRAPSDQPGTAEHQGPPPEVQAERDDDQPASAGAIAQTRRTSG